MSASNPKSSIYVSDSGKDIEKKINSAVSGAPKSRMEREQNEANLEVDIPFKYLSFFLDDDAKLEKLRRKYGAGRIGTGYVKEQVVQVLRKIVEEHCRNKDAVTEEILATFMAVRPLPKMVS